MRTLFERKILIALPAMLAIQSFGTMCGFAGAVVAVQAAVDLGVKSTSIGIFTAIIYVTGMLSGLGAGSLLPRYGVIRTGQVALLMGVLALGLVSALPLGPAAIGAAVLLGMGTGPLNPASSRILARHTRPQWPPFVFSVKQTGTPLRGLLAGPFLPPSVAPYDWRLAVVAISAIPLIMLFGLQLIRSDLDDDRDPAFRISFTGILASLRLILKSKPLVRLATAGYFYTFAQLSILSFIVIYLQEENGLSAEFAGGIFAIIHGSAIPARISRLFLAESLLLSNPTDTPKGSNQETKLSKCCSANNSVGAISAACCLLPTAINIARAATIVFPDPTSPCNKRIIGWFVFRSSSISSTTLARLFVSSKGSAKMSDSFNKGFVSGFALSCFVRLLSRFKAN